MKKIIDIYHEEAISSYDTLCDNVEFIIHKGSEGMTFTDKKCADRIKEFEKRKKPYWIYVFLRKGDELSQTQRLTELYKDKVGKYFVGYVLDIECNNSQDNCLRALDYLLKLPYKVMFYFSWGSAVQYPKLIAKRSDKCAYWECRYGDDAGNHLGTDRSSRYPFHSFADLGQYTEYGSCTGMVGNHNIDLNKITGNKNLSWFTTPLSDQNIKGKTYSGAFPALPPRGYWRLGDGKTDYVDYPTQIKRLQEFLIWAEFYNGIPDSVIGKNTRQAIIDFQNKVGLTPDGLFGKDTLAAAKEYRK